VVGLPLAVAVLVLSNRDLGRMRRGLLDPAGRGETEKAWGLALEGLVGVISRAGSIHVSGIEGTFTLPDTRNG
jgi:hypothetical protein